MLNLFVGFKINFLLKAVNVTKARGMLGFGDMQERKRKWWWEENMEERTGNHNLI
jgi:hypothetical protein